MGASKLWYRVCTREHNVSSANLITSCSMIRGHWSAMKLSRKSFLQLIGLVLLFPCVYWLRRLFVRSNTTGSSPTASMPGLTPTQIFEDLVDIIAPKKVAVQLDESAIVATVTQQTSLRVRSAPTNSLRLLNATARKRHGKTFVRLSRTEKKDVMNNATEVSTPDSYFLMELREEVMRHYYADPAVWQYLGQAEAPQPWGHLDYDKKPGSGSNA